VIETILCYVAVVLLILLQFSIVGALYQLGDLLKTIVFHVDIVATEVHLLRHDVTDTEHDDNECSEDEGEKGTN
jgi:hypothetical protein